MYMEREEFVRYMNIMFDLEGQWYREDGLYKFYHPENMTPEAVEAANKLNENYIVATDKWNRNIELYGNEIVVFHKEDYSDD